MDACGDAEQTPDMGQPALCPSHKIIIDLLMTYSDHFSWFQVSLIAFSSEEVTFALILEAHGEAC
jgi:hypothetical protein